MNICSKRLLVSPETCCNLQIKIRSSKLGMPVWQSLGGSKSIKEAELNFLGQDYTVSYLWFQGLSNPCGFTGRIISLVGLLRFFFDCCGLVDLIVPRGLVLCVGRGLSRQWLIVLCCTAPVVDLLKEALFKQLSDQDGGGGSAEGHVVGGGALLAVHRTSLGGWWLGRPFLQRLMLQLFGLDNVNHLKV